MTDLFSRHVIITSNNFISLITKINFDLFNKVISYANCIYSKNLFYLMETFQEKNNF